MTSPVSLMRECLSFRINRFGGTFGKTPETPFDQFDETDGISEYNDGKGFHLVVTIGPSANGTYAIDAKIEEEGPALDTDM
jgi:hypothetical protein